MLFFLTYLAFMLIPGWLLVEALNVRQNRLILSVALSVTVMTINIAIARKLGLSYNLVATAVALEVVIFAGVVMITRSSRWRTAYPSGEPLVWVLSAVVVTLVLAYAALTGPYLEIPADAWWHIGKVNDVMATITEFNDEPVRWAQVIDAPNWYGYFVPAMAASLSGYSIVEMLYWLHLANTMLFCAGIYTFALFVFEEAGLSAHGRYYCAAITVVFVILHFGINVFSYVRYYTYAPALVNYLVYIAAIALLLQFLREGVWRVAAPLFIVLSGTAYLIHRQEFLFVVIMSSAIVAVEYLTPVSQRAPGVVRAARVITPLFYAMMLLWTALWVYSYTSYDRSNPLTYGTVISLDAIFPFLKNLYVLHPNNRFYEVTGVWGIVVYVLFFFRLIKRQPLPSYVVAGMLVPFATIFNPLFVDLFLRHNYADVIWRICYLIPLPFAGAYLFLRAIQAVLEEQGIRSKLAGLVSLTLLIVLLWPISTTFFESRFSRIYTLKPTAAQVSYNQWQDLFEFLNTIDAETVITDQVTGYLVNALTPHDYHGDKFYGFGAPKINRKQYDEGHFWDYRGSLVIINLREGGMSETGRVSGHWPENILKTGRFYSKGFLAHVESNPQTYLKIWESDKIQVYEIQS